MNEQISEFFFMIMVQMEDFGISLMSCLQGELLCVGGLNAGEDHPGDLQGVR